MAASAKPPPTSVYAQFLAVPEHMIAEIIHGALVTQPRPATSHAQASTALGGELHGPFNSSRSPARAPVVRCKP